MISRTVFEKYANKSLGGLQKWWTILKNSVRPNFSTPKSSKLSTKVKHNCKFDITVINHVHQRYAAGATLKCRFQKPSTMMAEYTQGSHRMQCLVCSYRLIFFIKADLDLQNLNIRDTNPR